MRLTVSQTPDHILERLNAAHNTAAHAIANASLLQQEICRHKRPHGRALHQLAQLYLTLRDNLLGVLAEGGALRDEYNRAFGPIYGTANVSPLACQCAAYERAAAVREAIAGGLGLQATSVFHTTHPTLRQDLPENEAVVAWQGEMEEWRERNSLTHRPEWLATRFRECWREVRKHASQLPALDARAVSHDLGRGLDDAREKLLLLRATKVPETPPPTALAEQLSPLARAIAIMSDVREKQGRLITVRELLSMMPGVSRATLYRPKGRFAAARAAIRKTLRMAVPSGHVTEGGGIDAEDMSEDD
jgi:hypothetical protein